MYYQILNKIDDMYLTSDIDSAFIAVVAMLNASLQKGEIDPEEFHSAREYNRDCFVCHRYY